MNIPIKIILLQTVLFFTLVFSAQGEDTLPKGYESFSLRSFRAQVYYDDKSDTNEIDILNLAEEVWLPLPHTGIIPQMDKTVWIKVSLPEGTLGQELYLTEHSGLNNWEVFFFSENLLLDREVVDWDQYYPERQNLQTQFRGFTSFQVFNSNHKDVVLLVRLNPEITNRYDFYIRSQLNFQKNFSTWIFVQGIGMGFVLVVLLLTLVMSIRLRHKVDWLYLMMIIVAGINISYITGLGPQFAVAFLPWVSKEVWIAVLGVFNIFSVLFIEEFADFGDEYKNTRFYFHILKLLSIFSLAILFLVPRFKIYTTLNLISICIQLMILAGLIRLVVLKIPQAFWLLTGWSMLLMINTIGLVVGKVVPENVCFPVISYICGQTFLFVFLGAALIKQMDAQRLKESVRRQSAEHMAESVVKRMGDHKRMADLGAMVGSVTHELGTPLGVTVTLSSNITNTGRHIEQLFQEGDLSEDDFKTFLSDVLESSDLIEKNMESARILIDGFKLVAADQAAPDIRELHLKPYVAQFIRIMMTQIKKTPYELVQSIRDDITFTTIPGILTQVLTNLVNNAIIHGFSGREEGKIQISIDHMGEKKILITVQDNGVGIPPEIQKKVFNMYFTSKKGMGGTGIGLSIVKSLVEERLLGTIALESEEGKGSVFSILLPIDLKDNL